MNVAISEVRKGAEGKTEWHIKNWAADFFVLQEHANCKLIIVDETPLSSWSPAHLRFYFKPYEEKNSNGLVTSSWLSLNTELLSGGYVPMIILVDVGGAENMKNPMEIKSTRCTLRKSDNKSLAMTTIREKFIHLERYSYTPMGQLATTDRFSKDTDLRFNITVSILNVNEDRELSDCRTTMHEDNSEATANYCPGSEISLSTDLKRMYGADENFSDLQLETKDNMTLSCHRFILAARSPVFRKMIEEKQIKFDKKEESASTSMIIKLRNINAKPLIAVLHWMYSGELHEDAVKVMEEVVEICIAYKISALLNILDNKLISVCSTQNMFQLFQVAQQNGMKNAMDAISHFIKENICNVVSATQE